MVQRLRVFHYVGYFFAFFWRGPPRACLPDGARRPHGLLRQVKEGCAMRSLTTSLAILLALAACGRGVTCSAQGGDAGTNAGTAALPPAPVPTFAPGPPPAPVPTFAPGPSPVPVPAFAPGPVFSRAPAAPARDGFGNPRATQTPIAGPISGVPSNDHAAAAATPYGYYYPRPYGYSAGYGGYYNYSPGYYNYGPGYRGSYYGPGGYYGQPGISIEVGRGGGVRIGF